MRRATVTFFTATFAVTWSCFIGSAMLRRFKPEDAPAIVASGGLLLLGVFAPAVVALALTALERGRGGVRALVESILPSGVAVGWYVFAAGFFATVKLVAALVHRALFGLWPAFGSEPWYLIAVALLFSTPVQAGEELGWRAYALPRMAAAMGLGPASVALGVLWASWHLPLFFMAAADTFNQSFPVYLLQVTAVSVVMGWLYWRTGRALLLVMLFHAAANNTKDIVPSAVAVGTTPWTLQASPVAWITVTLLWLIAGGLLIRMRGKTLSSR